MCASSPSTACGLFQSPKSLGARFGVASVHKILTNPVFAGRSRFNQRESKSGRAKDENEVIEVAVPAIIERSVFDKVQTSLIARNPRVLPPRVVTGPILLTGLALCASCGARRLASNMPSSPENKSARVFAVLYAIGAPFGIKQRTLMLLKLLYNPSCSNFPSRSRRSNATLPVRWPLSSSLRAKPRLPRPLASEEKRRSRQRATLYGNFPIRTS